MAMEEGTIVEWFVKEGDIVDTGDVLAEIETDKSTMELESDYDGSILKILYEDGSTVPVTETIAWIGKPGEIAPDNPKSTIPEPISDQSSEPDRIKATPAAKRVAAEKGIHLNQVNPTGRHGEIREADVLSINPVRATPLAQRVAQSEGLDLFQVQGTGHEGKVFVSDLSSPNSASVDQSAPVENVQDRIVPLTKIQKITGERLLRSHTEIPVVSMDTRADVTKLLGMRKELNETLETKITINDFILKAAAMALKENPRVNSVLDNDNLIYKGSVNLSMAVATDRGLLVPVIRDADKLTIRQLSLKAADMASKGREGKLTPNDMEGGTFTISNIGMYGITSFTPIINQPQAAILGVCAIEEKLTLVDGAVNAVQVMGLSLTFDHRIVDGAEASIFLSRIRELLEKPLAILA